MRMCAHTHNTADGGVEGGRERERWSSDLITTATTLTCIILAWSYDDAHREKKRGKRSCVHGEAANDAGTCQHVLWYAVKQNERLTCEPDGTPVEL